MCSFWTGTIREERRPDYGSRVPRLDDNNRFAFVRPYNDLGETMDENTEDQNIGGTDSRHESGRTEGKQSK